MGTLLYSKTLREAGLPAMASTRLGIASGGAWVALAATDGCLSTVALREGRKLLALRSYAVA